MVAPCAKVTVGSAEDLCYWDTCFDIVTAFEMFQTLWDSERN